MPSPSEIADTLTPAQKRWILHGAPSHARGYWSTYNALKRKGLIGPAGELMPLAIQVRAFLEHRTADAR